MLTSHPNNSPLRSRIKRPGVIKPSDSPLKNGRLRTKSYNQYAFSSLFPSSSSQSPEGRNGTLSQKRQNSDLKSQISSPSEDNLYPTFSLDSPYDFKQDQANNLVPSKELGGFSKFKLNEFGRSSKKINTTSRGSPTLSQTSTRLGLETLNTSFSQKFYTEDQPKEYSKNSKIKKKFSNLISGQRILPKVLMPESNSPVRIHNHRRNLTSDSTPIQRGRQIQKENKVKSGMTFLLDDKEETSSKMELNTHDYNHTELFVNDFRQLFRSQLENSQYPTTGNSNTSEVSSKRIENPLNRLVKSKNGKLPFLFTLNVETRQKIFREIEKKSHERGDLESLVNKRNKEVPEAQARFLKKIHDIELKKKEEDLRSRSPERNVLYNFYALDNNSQRKVRKKLQAQLSGVSRFSDI